MTESATTHGSTCQSAGANTLKTRTDCSPVARTMIQASLTGGPVLNVMELDQVISRCGFTRIDLLIRVDIGLPHTCTPRWADQSRPHCQQPCFRG